MMQPNICNVCFRDCGKRLGHAVDEWLGAYESSIGICLRLRNEVLAAAKANFEAHLVNRTRVKSAKIARDGRGVDAKLRQHCREQRLLLASEPATNTAPEECSAGLVCAPGGRDNIRAAPA